MSFLPDEIWSKILEMGAAANRLSYRDLCSLAITCRRHNRLSSDPSIWSILLALDFPQPISSSSSLPVPSKSLYRTRFERDKARRIAASRRAILIAESQVSVCKGRLKELECQLRKEGERMKGALEELSNLERIRRASVALNVWQPELVRGSQRQMVEQCTVPIESRLSNLKMEVNLCKHQISIFKNAYVRLLTLCFALLANIVLLFSQVANFEDFWQNEQKQRLQKSKEALSSQQYNPLEAYHSNVSRTDSGTKRKKLT
ncbi:F-box protein SKIP24 [Dendrobium catenatum]|uniref:F-box protein SKIP24 n=1 Tax=Dendrobium catenatum TaxID=906689 RepID=A0A2I0VH32_9ASPA|nr:F-box protein SKIP24 [Dendrobium catenatum]